MFEAPILTQRRKGEITNFRTCLAPNGAVRTDVVNDQLFTTALALAIGDYRVPVGGVSSSLNVPETDIMKWAAGEELPSLEVRQQTVDAIYVALEKVLAQFRG